MRGRVTDARMAYPDVLHVEVRDAAGGMWRLATQDAEFLPNDPTELAGSSVPMPRSYYYEWKSNETWPNPPNPGFDSALLKQNNQRRPAYCVLLGQTHNQLTKQGSICQPLDGL
jgi:hypothetical protein